MGQGRSACQPQLGPTQSLVPQGGLEGADEAAPLSDSVIITLRTLERFKHRSTFYFRMVCLGTQRFLLLLFM